MRRYQSDDDRGSNAGGDARRAYQRRSGFHLKTDVYTPPPTRQGAAPAAPEPAQTLWSAARGGRHRAGGYRWCARRSASAWDDDPIQLAGGSRRAAPAWSLRAPQIVASADPLPANKDLGVERPEVWEFHLKVALMLRTLRSDNRCQPDRAINVQYREYAAGRTKPAAGGPVRGERE
jgi:hypothetical protein